MVTNEVFFCFLCRKGDKNKMQNTNFLFQTAETSLMQCTEKVCINTVCCFVSIIARRSGSNS